MADSQFLQPPPFPQPRPDGEGGSPTTPAAGKRPSIDLADSIFGLELSVGRPNDPTEEIEAFLQNFSSASSAESLDERGLFEAFRRAVLLQRSIAVSDAVRSVREPLGDSFDEVTRGAENADEALNEFYQEASPFELYKILGNGQHALGIFTRAVLQKALKEVTVEDLMNQTPRGTEVLNRVIDEVSQELTHIASTRITEKAGQLAAGVDEFLKGRTADLWEAATEWFKAEIKIAALLGETPSLSTCIFEPSVSSFRMELASEDNEPAPPVSEALRTRLAEVLDQVASQVKAKNIAKKLPLDLQERLKDFTGG